MDAKDLLKALKSHTGYFIQIQGDSTMYKGWKLSIQGKTLEDSKFLFDNLIGLLLSTKANFKFATQKLIDLKHAQQSTKLLTVYVPDDVDPESYAELVKLNLSSYEGADGIKTPESYTPYSAQLGIYFRNDRNEDGEYIPAN